MLEKLARPSASVDAPTVMALGAEHGLMVHASAPRLLPAATMTGMRAAASALTASLSDAERGPTSDMLTTALVMPLRATCDLTLRTRAHRMSLEASALARVQRAHLAAHQFKPAMMLE